MAIRIFPLKAEACRQLADIQGDPKRKALWVEREEIWEQLAIKAEKRTRSRLH
jgi:hypothetical protein